MRPVLQDLWRDAWKAGEAAATGISGDAHAPGFNSRDFMERWGRQWLNEIVQTRISGLAKILADGPSDLPGLIREVKNYLQDVDAADLIAVTEVTRAVNIAAMESYRAGGIFGVRWVTEGPDPCPQCVANAAAGSRQLGMPFPSGAVAPPQHPRCRCALLPA